MYQDYFLQKKLVTKGVLKESWYVRSSEKILSVDFFALLHIFILTVANPLNEGGIGIM